APPPQPTAVRTVQLRIVTRMRRATCIVSPSLRKCVVRRCPTRQPFPERVRVVGQAPLLEDRQGHCPHAAFAPAGGQALLGPPRPAGPSSSRPAGPPKERAGAPS